jgi:hypothetical protein
LGDAMNFATVSAKMNWPDSLLNKHRNDIRRGPMCRDVTAQSMTDSNLLEFVLEKGSHIIVDV